MTRKDFEIVAEIIAVIGSEDREVLLTQSEIACERLKKLNGRFDAERFVGAVLSKRRAIEETLSGVE